jgi:hypothetical protein
MLASALQSIGFLSELSARSKQAFGLTPNEKVVIALEVSPRSPLKGLGLELQYRNRPGRPHVRLDALAVTDRRILGLLNEQRLNRRGVVKHEFRYRDAAAGTIFERDMRTLLRAVHWNSGNPAYINFDCRSEQAPAADTEKFVAQWRTGLGTGAALFLTAALMSKQHTQADAAGNVYIASKLGPMFTKPVPTNLMLLLEDVPLAVDFQMILGGDHICSV